MTARPADVGRPRYDDETEQYLRAICHDLRAPARQIGEFTQLLLSELGDDIGDDGRTYIDFIQKATDRQADRLAGLERVTAARSTPMTIETVELGALVDAASSAVVAERGRAEADVDVVDGSTTLEVDRALFTEALTEVLANAVDYSPERASVRISAETSDGGTTVTVADSGSGMRASDAAVACDLFARFHRQAVSGTGVGLTVVRTVVERHGGSVTIDADVDRGTEVRMTVPTTARTASDVPASRRNGQ